MLTAADILRWAANAGRSDAEGIPLAACAWTDWQVEDVKAVRQDEVRQHMTRNPLLVTSDTRLPEVATALLGPHRRAVVVVDDERRPLGVVSATGILVALTSTDVATEGLDVVAATSREPPSLLSLGGERYGCARQPNRPRAVEMADPYADTVKSTAWLRPW